MCDKMMFERRAVPKTVTMVPKMMPVVVNTGAQRECRIANLSGIPYDYVPPPEDFVSTTIPFKWPASEDWSRMPSW